MLHPASRYRTGVRAKKNRAIALGLLVDDRGALAEVDQRGRPGTGDLVEIADEFRRISPAERFLAISRDGRSIPLSCQMRVTVALLTAGLRSLAALRRSRL
jgi:hypothetical protein